MDDAELWTPRVDEPIGELVARLQAEDPEVAALAASPRRQLAFRAFAHVRVGLVLGELLLETDVRTEAPGAWLAEVLADPAAYERVAEEVRAVAREVAADPSLAADEAGPDPAARERFTRLAREEPDV